MKSVFRNCHRQSRLGIFNGFDRDERGKIGNETNTGEALAYRRNGTREPKPWFTPSNKSGSSTF